MCSLSAVWYFSSIGRVFGRAEEGPSCDLNARTCDEADVSGPKSQISVSAGLGGPKRRTTKVKSGYYRFGTDAKLFETWQRPESHPLSLPVLCCRRPARLIRRFTNPPPTGRAPTALPARLEKQSLPHGASTQPAGHLAGCEAKRRRRPRLGTQPVGQRLCVSTLDGAKARTTRTAWP